MTREAIGGSIFVLGQLIGVGGAVHSTIDSVIPLYEDVNARDHLREVSGQDRNSPTLETGEIARLNNAIEDRTREIWSDIFLISLAAGTPSYIGARIFLGGRNEENLPPEPAII